MHGGVYLAGRLTGLGTDVYHWTIRCWVWAFWLLRLQHQHCLAGQRPYYEGKQLGSERTCSPRVGTPACMQTFNPAVCHAEVTGVGHRPADWRIQRTLRLPLHQLGCTIKLVNALKAQSIVFAKDASGRQEAVSSQQKLVDGLG